MSKEGARNLAERLDVHLRHESNRGLPLTPLQCVCLTLAQLGGAHFQRIEGLVDGVTQSCINTNFHKTVRAINTLKGEEVFIPNDRTLRANSEEALEKYKLPGFGFGIDGVHMIFEDLPHAIPNGRSKREFRNRKSSYSLNTQIIGGIDGLIYDIDYRLNSSFLSKFTKINGNIHKITQNMNEECGCAVKWMWDIQFFP